MELDNSLTMQNLQNMQFHIDRLERDLARERARPTVTVATTVPGLVDKVEQMLPLDLQLGDIETDIDLDGDLRLTLRGITTDSSGLLERRAIEFEIVGTITIPVAMRVTATSEDEAHDRAADTLRDIADDIQSPATYWGEGVDDVGFDGFGIVSEVDTVQEV